MIPEPREHRELLAWAAAIVDREHGRGTTGEIRIQLHEGIIQRVRVETTECPPKK
jgi:hypothetical protein